MWLTYVNGMVGCSFCALHCKSLAGKWASVEVDSADAMTKNCLDQHACTKSHLKATLLNSLESRSSELYEEVGCPPLQQFKDVLTWVRRNGNSRFLISVETKILWCFAESVREEFCKCLLGSEEIGIHQDRSDIRHVVTAVAGNFDVYFGSLKMSQMPEAATEKSQTTFQMNVQESSSL